MLCIMYNVQYTLYKVHCFMKSVQYTAVRTAIFTVFPVSGVYCIVYSIVGSRALYALKKLNALYALKNQKRTFIFQNSSIKLQYTIYILV